MSDRPSYPDPTPPADIAKLDGAPIPQLAVTGMVEVTAGAILFDPVPRARRRRNGWLPETQRAFIEALELCGCVSAAARAVGMTPRSAYRLLDAPGADSFAAAWDQAIARGVELLRMNALGRALHGSWVPVRRRGQIVRVEHRHDNRLAIALLSGRDHCVADKREQAVSRRKYREQVLALRQRERLKKELAAEIRAEHQAVLDRIEEEKANPVPLSVRSPPRIRRL